MIDTPDFATPPVVELILGVQFAPLTNLHSGHFGLFWQQMGSEWVHAADGALIEDNFETFDARPWPRTGLQLKLEPVRPTGRFTLSDASRERMVQIQPTRFHYNWVKRVGFYPSYRHLIDKFEACFEQFRQFVRDQKLGELQPNQWELTYIDAFPKGVDWQTPADWSKLLPGLFGKLFSTDGLETELTHRAAEWVYEIKPRRGRLHISGQPGHWGEANEESLLLTMTARGPIGRDGTTTLREGLDIGHNAAVGTFLRVSSLESQAQWGQK